MSVPIFIAEFIATLALNAIKDELGKNHSKRKIKKSIKEFAERQFKDKFINLPPKNEFDYTGLQKYLNEELSDYIKIYLFDVDKAKRERCKESIIHAAYNFASAKDKDVISKFMNDVLDIAKDYYVKKLKDNDKLLVNIAIDTIIEHISTKIGSLPPQPNQLQPPNAITNPAPAAAKEFIHRDEKVKELHNAIKENRKIVLINGLGGIGKTTIARKLYHAVKDEFKHIAWIEYQNNIKNSLLKSITLFNDIKDEADRYGKIEIFLNNAKKDTILFIDNVSYENYSESGLEWIESLEVNVVLTSRRDEIGTFEKFPIDFMTEEQCVDIFYKYYKRDKNRTHEKTVLDLVRMVQRHTLSVELLACVSNSYGKSLEIYLAELTEKGFAYPDLHAETAYMQYNPQTIAEHLKILFSLVEVTEKQKRILKNFSLMPNIEIPLEVETWIDCHRNDMIELTKLGWLRFSGASYFMHAVVKEAIKLQYDVQYEDFEQIIDYMGSDEYIKIGDIYTDVYIRLEIAEMIMSNFADVENGDMGRLYNKVGVAYDDLCNHTEALEYYNKALEIFEKVYGEEHPSTATSYNNIGYVYDDLGNHTKALEYYSKDLAICKKVYGENHPDTATSYNNIGAVYKTLCKYTEALEYYNKALAIKEKIYGEHPDTAISYNNIGAVYKTLGNYTEVLEYFSKALAIKEKIYGEEHPSTATSYNNIGAVYDTIGNYTEALEYYNKALAIFKKVYGVDHPSTITVKENIEYVTTTPTPINEKGRI